MLRRWKLNPKVNPNETTWDYYFDWWQAWLCVRQKNRRLVRVEVDSWVQLSSHCERGFRCFLRANRKSSKSVNEERLMLRGQNSVECLCWVLQSFSRCDLSCCSLYLQLFQFVIYISEYYKFVTLRSSFLCQQETMRPFQILMRSLTTWGLSIISVEFHIGRKM